MDISEKELEEALEILWTLEIEEENGTEEEFSKRFSGKTGKARHRQRFCQRYRERMEDEALPDLRTKNLVEGDRLKLTEQGRKIAKNIVRRHRLAERLMVDVLSMSENEAEKPACELEHLISEGVADRICTLLGHPNECPHGMPIPEGECCSREEESLEPAIKPLNKSEEEKELEVAYLKTKQDKRINKLLSYDIGPGSKVVLRQKDPTYVVRTGESDIALEEAVVKDIYVKTT